jgi:hypothetical protein
MKKYIASTGFVLLMIGFTTPISAQVMSSTQEITSTEAGATTTAVKENKKASSLLVHISRADQSLRLTILCANRAGGDCTVRLKDVSGTVLYEEAIISAEYVGKFDMYSLPNGSYSVEIVNSKETYRKTVKLRKKDGVRTLEVK